MIVARTIEEIENAISGACVTIGNFDGVHKGHQKLIGLAVSRAKEQGLTSVVVTLIPIRFGSSGTIRIRLSSP